MNFSRYISAEASYIPLPCRYGGRHSSDDDFHTGGDFFIRRRPSESRVPRMRTRMRAREILTHADYAGIRRVFHVYSSAAASRFAEAP
jgi:hypothetical protein